MADQIETPQTSLRDFYEGLARALKDTKPIPQNTIDAARERELEKMAQTATELGVDPDDYRKWCAGVKMPHVHAAVLASKK